MDSGKYFVGEDLKFKITLTADGFDQDTDDYQIEFVCGSYTHTYTQDDIVKGADGGLSCSSGPPLPGRSSRTLLSTR